MILEACQSKIVINLKDYHLLDCMIAYSRNITPMYIFPQNF